MRTERLTILPQPQGDLRPLVDAFLVHQEAARHTPKTMRHYSYTLSNLLDFLESQGVLSAQEVTPHHLRLFFSSLAQRGLKDTTLHAHARAAKTFFRWLVAEELLGASPMAKVKMPKLEQKILPAFGLEEVGRLLGACGKDLKGLRDRALLLCLLDSGLRVSEAASLRVGDVNLRTGLAKVKGKGRKERLVRLGAKARLALQKYLLRRRAQEGEPLWMGERGPLTPNGIGITLAKLGQRAQVEPCRPHRFRRTCALWSLRAGMDVYSLQLLMGHSDLQVLRRYLAQVEQDLEEAHKRAGPVDRWL